MRRQLVGFGPVLACPVLSRPCSYSYTYPHVSVRPPPELVPSHSVVSRLNSTFGEAGSGCGLLVGFRGQGQDQRCCSVPAHHLHPQLHQYVESQPQPNTPVPPLPPPSDSSRVKSGEGGKFAFVGNGQVEIWGIVGFAISAGYIRFGAGVRVGFAVSVSCSCSRPAPATTRMY